MYLSHQLKELEKTGQQISIGLIGAGQMGTDIVSQVTLMPALSLVAIADIDEKRALEAYHIAGHAEDCAVCVKSLDELNRARLNGKFTAATDYRLITDAPKIEAVIESTGHPDVSSRATLRTIFQHKHLITMSVEMDITVGPLLNWYAQQHGVIYAIGAGDEPSALYELYDFAESLGLTIVAGGKGKNNPLNRDAVPEDLAEEAARRGLTPEMLIEFVDGSKTMIEMAAVANATGLVPDVFGLHGPNINIAQFNNTFALKENGGILEKQGVVDYVIGDLAPGVFLVVTTDKPRLREALILRDMGNGPNYTLLRPYHLCSMEVPLSVAQAVLQNKSTMAPLPRLVAEVVSVAKTDLKPGQVLERIGGHTHYGMTDCAENAAHMGAVPIGLARDSVVRKPVAKGKVITYDHVDLPEGLVINTLRELQDAWAAGDIAEDVLRQRLDELAVQEA